MVKLQSTYPPEKSENCIAFSFASLNLLINGIEEYPDKKFPNAKLVIGSYVRDENEQLSTDLIDKIKSYSSDPLINDIPVFHAWVDLGHGDILDFVAPGLTADLNHFRFLNKERAIENKFYYRPVLTLEADTIAFFEKHKKENRNIDPYTP